MQDVQFDESQQSNVFNRVEKNTALTRLFISLKLGKDAKQAQLAMLIVIILALSTAAYFIYKAFTLGLF